MRLFTTSFHHIFSPQEQQMRGKTKLEPSAKRTAVQTKSENVIGVLALQNLGLTPAVSGVCTKRCSRVLLRF